MRFLSMFAAGAMVVASGLVTPGAVQADGNFKLHARGVTIDGLIGRTLVGVTRSNSNIWSVSLGRDGTARYLYSNGERRTAKWRKRSRNIICFTGLIQSSPSKEICKLARAHGRGLDWLTVRITGKTESGTIKYVSTKKGETRGSSQIVYSVPFGARVSQIKPSANIYNFRGKAVIGRTLKDKEIWAAEIKSNGRLSFAYASGKRFTGSYKINAGAMCFTFPGVPQFDSCHRLEQRNGKLLWKNTATGGAISEVVFTHKLDTPKVMPKPKAAPARKAEPVLTSGPNASMLGSTVGSDSGSNSSSSTAPKTSVTTPTQTGNKNLVGNLSLSNGAHMAVASRAGNLAVVLTKKPTKISLYSLPGRYRIGEIVGSYDRVAMDGERNILAIRRSRMSLFSLKNGARTWTQTIFGRGLLAAEFVGADNRFVVLGDAKGQLSLHERLTGAQLELKKTGTSIIDIRTLPSSSRFATLAKDGVITGWQVGPSRRLMKKWTLKTGKSDGVMFDLTEGSQHLVVGFRNGDMRIYDVSEARPELLRDAKKVVSRIDSLELAPGDGSVAVAEGSRIYLLPYPALIKARAPVITGRNLSAPHVFSAEGDVLALSGGQVKLFAASGARANDLRQRGHLKLGADKVLATGFRTAQKAEKTRHSRVSGQARAAFDRGDCDAYVKLRAEVGVTLTKPACLRMYASAQLRKQFKAKIAALDCDGADRIAQKSKSSLQRKQVAECRKKAGNNVDLRRFQQAKADGDCDLVEQLWARVGGSPADVTQCRDAKKPAPAASARTLFFAAVKKETSRDYRGAMALYQEIMDTFPEDSLAIDAAKRIVELNDKVQE
ncbi:hypothetical protein N4R57_20430 [Rhodobacteraceae bacterium D3-12]|nr:hypothetical protein N4R57_20430 [Rhodobacteraceae bacterium D3-12]